MENEPLYTINNEVHTALVGIHLQDPVPDWTQAVPRFPTGTVHEFFQTQPAAEAKQIDPSCRTIHRHFIAHQDPYLYAQDKDAAARAYLNTFIDGSFMVDAPYIDMTCDLNEYFGGESPQERLQKIAWAQALARVWATEYRTRQGLGHIRLVLARTAVGNDIPIEVAQAAKDYDAVLSYHPYVPVNNGIILGHGAGSSRIAGNVSYAASSASMIEDEDYVVRASFGDVSRVARVEDVEWTYFSGRWTQMDAYYRSQSIAIDWVFTEIGPVLYTEDQAGNIHLNAGAGWRWHEVYNANVEGYISALSYWAGRTAQWNAENNNRALGGQMFTSNQPHNGWEYFRTNMPELGTIADYFRNWSPDIDPPPTDELTRLFAAAEASQVIAQMPGTALQENILGDNRQCIGNEFNFVGDDNTNWVCRYAGDGGTTPKWVYMFPVGDYRPSSLRIQEFV